jgi:hypothetical protein
MRSFLVVLALVATSLCSRSAAAQVTWKKEWPRFRVSEGITTAAFSLGIVGGLVVLKQQEDAWSGGILFDEGIRDAVTIESRSTRDAWVLRGDITFYFMTAAPFLDAAITAGLVHGKGDVARELALMDLQAMSMSGFVSVWTQKLGGRVRPLVRECGADPEYDKDCDDDIQRNQSFLSGHTAMSFTGAGLICIQHANIPLYGGGFPDGLACGLGLGAASFVGVSRLIADRHYTSDVLAGVLIGGVSGFLLPGWWHFGLFDAGKGPAKTQMVVSPFASGDALGLGLYGIN